MLFIESLGKIYYCLIKNNRLVDDTRVELGYRDVDSLDWYEREVAHGKIIKIIGFPKENKVKLFRVTGLPTARTCFVSNGHTQDLTKGAQQSSALRWKIEQFHREAKQLIGIERCQCRKARVQRNHIACAILVWVRLDAVAKQTG